LTLLMQCAILSRYRRRAAFFAASFASFQASLRQAAAYAQAPSDARI
jgi:hypothetical protein